MAWLEREPTDIYQICFRFGGRKFKRSLKTKSEREANARLLRLEENLRLVDSGRLEMPEDGDPGLFLLSDGKISRKPKARQRIDLTSLFQQYLDALPDGALETSTIKTIKIHRGHLERLLGKSFPIRRLAQTDLQSYIAKRSKEKGIRNRPLSAVTIRKEVNALRSVWKWAVTAKLLNGDFPNAGLKYPKTDEKPPFQTWDEIEATISQAKLLKEEQADLWDCLFLSTSEIAELLAYVKEFARHSFVYPMFVMAAHTGARRSELLQSQLTDFRGGFVTIREKKRKRGQRSTRRVPISNELSVVMNEWLSIHPGGRFTFAMGDIAHSKTKRDGPQPISRDSAHNHFERTLDGSKWEVIRGWHCLRHSFCSNCAMMGIDQRLIDSWVGHTTNKMRERYRHLFPNHEAESLRLVFS